MIKNLYNAEFKPLLVISDNADYIRSASVEVWGEKTINQLCDFHRVKANKRQIQIKDKLENSGIILFGIHLLRETRSKSDLTELWKLVSNYWRECDISNQFIRKINI